MAAPVNRGFVRERGRVALRRRPDFFISHSSEDKHFVRTLANELTKVGVDVWLDEWEMEAGDSLLRSLGLALEKSRFVGIVISPKLLKSEWSMDELGQALAREKRERSKVIIPLLHKKAVAPPFIEDRLYVDFSKEFFMGLAELSQVVHSLSRAKFKQATASRIPHNLAEVWSILAECGWDRESLFDPRDIRLLRDRFDSLGIKYQRGERGSVWLSDRSILKHRTQLGGLKVVDTMLEFFERQEAVAINPRQSKKDVRRRQK